MAPSYAEACRTSDLIAADRAQKVADNQERSRAAFCARTRASSSTAGPSGVLRGMHAAIIRHGTELALIFFYGHAPTTTDVLITHGPWTSASSPTRAADTSSRTQMTTLASARPHSNCHTNTLRRGCTPVAAAHVDTPDYATSATATAASCTSTRQ